MASAGRILIIPKGDYSDQTTYTNLDLVFYNNTSWLCRKECKGVKPSSATSEYWFRFSAIALANNLTTNADGYALDAKQGVVIKTNLDNLSLAINGLSDDVSALAASIDTLLSQNVAAIYDASKTYAAGDYVVYNNKLYECKTDVTVPEEFDSSKWTETYIMTSIDARVDAVLDQILDTKLSGIKGMIANEYRNDITYDVGAIVSYNGNLYKCIEDVTLAEEFDSSKWEETTMSDNLGGDAAGITYDNAKSGLKSNNVQGAVDELSSSLASLNVRYNSETDKIEAYYNGSWVDVISAGLQDIILYSPGDTHNDVTGGYIVVQNGTLEYNSTNMIFNCSTSGSNTVGTFKTNKIINNIHSKNKLILDLYIYNTGGWSAIGLYDAKGQNLYQYKPNDGVAFYGDVHHEIDLSTIDTDFEVVLDIMRWNAGSTAYIRVDNIYTE